MASNSPQIMPPPPAASSPFTNLSISELFDKPQAICIACFVKSSKGGWELQWDVKTLEAILEHERHANKKLINICIGGSSRTGKSMLLNFNLTLLKKMEQHEPISLLDGKSDDDSLEGYIEGFKCNSGIDPVTNGLQMWSRPTVYKDGHGREVVVLLFDCEGISGGRQGIQAAEDKSIDAQLFTICCAISSIMVYNFNGVIDQQHLDTFLNATKYGKIINGLKAPYQNLVFLRRNANDNEAGYDKEKISLDKFSEKNAYRHLVSNPNVNVYTLPTPGPAIAKKSDAYREALINGRCAIRDIDHEFLHHAAELFKLMIPIDQNNGRIADHVLKSRIKDNGELHYLNCGEFLKQFVSILTTLRDANFNTFEDFSSLFGSILAKSAGIEHMKMALAEDKKMNGLYRIDLCEINDFYAKHIPIALDLFKIVHYWCVPEKLGQPDKPRGKEEHFTMQGNAFFQELKKMYTVSKKKNDEKPCKSLNPVPLLGAAAISGAGAVGVGGSLSALLLLAAVNPVLAVAGISASAIIAVGTGAVIINQMYRNSGNFVELQIGDMIKDRTLERLYKYRIDVDLYTKIYSIWDEKGKLKYKRKITPEMEEKIKEAANGLSQIMTE